MKRHLPALAAAFILGGLTQGAMVWVSHGTVPNWVLWPAMFAIGWTCAGLVPEREDGESS